VVEPVIGTVTGFAVVPAPIAGGVEPGNGVTTAAPATKILFELLVVVVPVALIADTAQDNVWPISAVAVVYDAVVIAILVPLRFH